MTFDRLIYIDRLRGAGVADEVARAHAEALSVALVETVATKADLKEAVDRLDRKFEGRFEALDRKIEITARDLVIKGAAGLVIIASLIVGLKLFG